MTSRASSERSWFRRESVTCCPFWWVRRELRYVGSFPRRKRYGVLTFVPLVSHTYSPQNRQFLPCINSQSKRCLQWSSNVVEINQCPYRISDFTNVRAIFNVHAACTTVRLNLCFRATLFLLLCLLMMTLLGNLCYSDNYFKARAVNFPLNFKKMPSSFKLSQ